jgi:CheY-like chemotaxis protein
LTDEKEKNLRAIVPSVGDELTKPGSGLIHRGLLELSKLGLGRGVGPSSEKPRVLVCDDDKGIAEFISTMLEVAGYEVRSTLKSFEAIQIAREFQPHVALLGKVMPGMDGFELAVELTNFLPRAKIVLTSEAEQSDLELIRKRGWPFDILPCPNLKGNAAPVKSSRRVARTPWSTSTK